MKSLLVAINLIIGTTAAMAADDKVRLKKEPILACRDLDTILMIEEAIYQDMARYERYLHTFVDGFACTNTIPMGSTVTVIKKANNNGATCVSRDKYELPGASCVWVINRSIERPAH